MNNNLFPEGPEAAAHDMAQALMGMADRGTDMQKLKTLNTLTSVIENAQTKKHYSYIRSTERPGYYDFYLNGEITATMRVPGMDMADFMLNLLENGFKNGVTYTTTEVYKSLKS